MNTELDREGIAENARSFGCLFKGLAALVLVYAFYKLLWPTFVWNEKTVIEVATAGQASTGESVVRRKVVYEPQLLPGMRGRQNSMRGEATAISLGDGRYLFGLLKKAPGGRGAVDVFADRFSEHSGWRTKQAWFFLISHWLASPMQEELHPMDYPLLVTFDDIADPASVKRVDPLDMDAALGLCPDGSGLTDEDAPWRAEGMAWREWRRFKASGLPLEEYRHKRTHNGFDRNDEEELEAAIGERDTSADCHQLKSITLEITSDPVTSGKVETVLPCLNSGKACIPLDESRPYGNPMRNILNSAFRRR